VGTERVFCSGGQLKDYARLKKREDGLKINRQIQKNLDTLEKHSAWKVALVGGDCFGGGIEFLGCFDVIYAAPEVLFGFWQNKMGVSYGWGGYKRLQKKVSAAFLKKALLEEKIVTAYQLKDVGLVDEIIPQNMFESAANEIEKRFSSRDSKIEIQKNLHKNADGVFRQLWWKDEHLAQLRKLR
jgi:enoyl-CoA hydratase